MKFYIGVSIKTSVYFKGIRYIRKACKYFSIYSNIYFFRTCK